jgi:hypothetical protein
MAGDGGRVPDVSEQRAELEAVGEAMDAWLFAVHGTVSSLRASDVGAADVIAALDDARARGDDEGHPPGYNEAGPEWLEPWCDEHPDGDGQGCVACIGASHDAWMHRAKDAEARLDDPASVLAALLAESPEATVAAIEALLTTDEAVDGLIWESPYGLQRHTARRMLGRACRSLLSKAPKEAGDA